MSLVERLFVGSCQQRRNDQLVQVETIASSPDQGEMEFSLLRNSCVRPSSKWAPTTATMWSCPPWASSACRGRCSRRASAPSVRAPGRTSRRATSPRAWPTRRGRCGATSPARASPARPGAPQGPAPWQVDELVRRIDPNGDGLVTLAEFSRWVAPPRDTHTGGQAAGDSARRLRRRRGRLLRRPGQGRRRAPEQRGARESPRDLPPRAQRPRSGRPRAPHRRGHRQLRRPH